MKLPSKQKQRNVMPPRDSTYRPVKPLSKKMDNNNQMAQYAISQIDSQSNIMYHQSSDQEGVYNYDIPDDNVDQQEMGY